METWFCYVLRRNYVITHLSITKVTPSDSHLTPSIHAHFFPLFRNGIRCRRRWQRKRPGSSPGSMGSTWWQSIQQHVLARCCSRIWMRAVLFCWTCCRARKTLRSITGWEPFTFETWPRHRFCSSRLPKLLVDTSAIMASFNSVISPRWSPTSSLSFLFTG